jgi:hypothetical protein
MVRPHNDHGEAPPMSCPHMAGTRGAYRALHWAAIYIDGMRVVLAYIRKESGEFYPLDVLYDGNPAALANEGLFVVAARRLVDAVELLAEACEELDFATLATLRAQTAPPPMPKRDPRGCPNGACLAQAEKALDIGFGPDLVDDRSAVAWLTKLVRACRLAAAALVASGYIDADCEMVDTAVARLAGDRV